MITALCLAPLALPVALVAWLLLKGLGAWLEYDVKKFNEKYPLTPEE